MHTRIILILISAVLCPPGVNGGSRAWQGAAYPALLRAFHSPFQFYLASNLYDQVIHVDKVARKRGWARSPRDVAFISPRDLSCVPIAQNRAGLARSDGSTNIGCLFSDIDGTLVHYYESEDDAPGPPAVLALPASSTGRKGRISVETLDLASRIRLKGTRLVLVSGTRYSTFVKRLPFLPRADAYVIENGGRIFYPRDAVPRDSAGAPGEGPEACSDAPATGMGSDSTGGSELESAVGDPAITAHAASALVEDTSWRARLESAAGPASQDSLPPEERKGALWDVYRQAVAAGLEVDTNTYYTMLRVKAKGGSEDERALQALITSLPSGLRVVTNLGMVDICPVASGKHNAAAYLAVERLGVPLTRCASMGDDDNDLDLVREGLLKLIVSSPRVQFPNVAHSAPNTLLSQDHEFTVVVHKNLLELVHRHGRNYVEKAKIMGKGAFITAFSSGSVEAAVRANPDRFRVASEAGVRASEEMLRLITEAC